MKQLPCGNVDMGTIYWLNDTDIDKLSETKPMSIDPEVDRIDFYIKSGGEYIPWNPSEGQLQILSKMGLPTFVPDKGAPSPPAPPK